VIGASVTRDQSHVTHVFPNILLPEPSDPRIRCFTHTVIQITVLCGDDHLSGCRRTGNSVATHRGVTMLFSCTIATAVMKSHR
jgi:hypothetical protein